jgi:hypothetical protein
LLPKSLGDKYGGRPCRISYEISILPSFYDVDLNEQVPLNEQEVDDDDDDDEEEDEEELEEEDDERDGEEADVASMLSYRSRGSYTSLDTFYSAMP